MRRFFPVAALFLAALPRAAATGRVPIVGEAAPLADASASSDSASSCEGARAAWSSSCRTPKSDNIFWSESEVSLAERIKTKSTPGVTVWLTGLSGSGKTTLAIAAESRLVREFGLAVTRLDGDNLRFGLNRNLGFSGADRDESVRRAGEVAKLLANGGNVVLVALISAVREARREVQDMHQSGCGATEAEKSARPELRNELGERRWGDCVPFVEVHVHCPLPVAESRDPKGLYAKAREGKLAGFTGIDSAYEVPEHAGLIIDTSTVSVAEGAAQIVNEVLRQLERAGKSVENWEMAVKESFVD